MTPEAILIEALKLTDEQRIIIANSLHESVFPVDPEIEAAWSDEISDRLREIDEGKVQMIPWEEVEKELREIVGDTE